MNPIEAYIRQAAQRHGIDPDVAVRVANSEGGLSNPFRHGEGPAPSSQDPRYGNLENSYGPFQLYVSGRGAGLGDRALAAGIDPQKDWQGGIDFALKEAAQKGWGQWYGAAKAGVGNQTGIGADGPKGQESYPPVFGSMSPGAPQDNSIPMIVADHLGNLGDSGQQKQNPLEKAGEALTAATKEFAPARINGAFGGDARQGADGLMKLLQNPQALAQMMLQKRLA